MRFTRALAGFLTTVVVGGVVVGVCLAALIPSLGIIGSATDYHSDLVTDLSDLSERSTVYNAAGDEIGVLGLENRSNVSLDQVPQSVIDAVIATEDKTFWENEGVDLSAVARAALKNLTSGEIEQGGSTISQQLVKNRILSPKRDLNRKVRELLLAIQLNKDYSKREILEQYLNTVYFGQGSYGIAAAIERLLIKPDPTSIYGARFTAMSEVTIGDAALLAGLVQSPEAYNPFVHPDLALQRRTFVLTQMREEGYITAEQEAAANLEPINFIKPGEDLRPTNSWVEEVQDRLFNDSRYAVLGADKAARENAVLRGGLKIYATLDPRAQANAQAAVDQTVTQEAFSASVVAMEPTTGAVRAMVSGRGFENSQYNIATSTPGRQPGSTWKVITLAAATQSHYSGNDQVSGSSPCDFGLALGKTQNAEGGEGVMSLRSATAGSVNCAFANLELSLGFTKVIDMAKKLGITQNTLQPFLTLTLGTIEATPLEMATVASSIANTATFGDRHEPYFIEKIVNPEGITIYQEGHPGFKVMDQDAALCEVDLLRGVVTGGTGTGAQVPGWAVAGKTGTTDGRADAWFLGMTPVLAAVVWHGNPLGKIGDAGFGGSIPATIFRRFMTAQLEGIEPQGWAAPPAWCNAPGQFLSQAGRATVPEGYEIVDGKLVPTTLPAPKVIVNPTPISRPTAITTQPPAPTTPPTTVKP